MYLEGNQANITNSIISTINSIFETLFSSLDNSIYETLDDLAFIDTNILNNSTFEKIFGVNSSNGILLIANSLLIAFVIYYGIKLLYSYYMNIQIERPYQFVFKLLIFAILLSAFMTLLAYRKLKKVNPINAILEKEKNE